MKISTLSRFFSVATIFTHFPVLILSHQSCGMYGAPPCRFLPAPPGQTPACAQPGKTYCEQIDNYPTYQIRRLLLNWGHEAKNFIVDETWEDFDALHSSHNCQTSSRFYDSILLGRQHLIGSSSTHQDPYNHHLPQTGYNYKSPMTTTQATGDNSLGSISVSPLPEKSNANPFLESKGERSGQTNFYGHSTNIGDGEISENATPNNPAIWFKRFVRDLELRKHRFRNMSMISNVFGSRNDNFFQISRQQRRVKRQSPGRMTLCPTTNRFITPQAALNSQGNWMFVVNEANTARQLVKTELCTTTECDNLCQIPNGYTARCEQKFVQKRILALQGDGENFYMDTFWFPSCCICTIFN